MLDRGNKSCRIQKSLAAAKNQYGIDFNQVLLEQYKIMRSSIVDLQNDRNTNNRFLIGIATALVGAKGFIALQSINLEASQYRIPLIIILSITPCLGIFICYIWNKWSSSYGIALGVRYTLLKKMEEHLPAQPFEHELDLRQQRGYVELAEHIRKLAWFFRIIFILLFITVTAANIFIFILPSTKVEQYDVDLSVSQQVANSKGQIALMDAWSHVG